MVITKKLRDSQFLPSVADLNAPELRLLARKLRSESTMETLNNILEWQDRNILYWKERAILELPRIPLIILFAILLWLALSLILSLVTFVLLKNIAISLLISATLTVIFSLWAIKEGKSIPVIYVILFAYPFYHLSKIFIPVNAEIAIQLSLMNGFLFGVALLTLVYLCLSYWPFVRRHAKFWEKIVKLFEMINDTFVLSLPVGKIISYRLAICRDYAKLAASLVILLCPDVEVYFVTILRHVATAVKFRNNFYVLDQKLPVVTLDSWHEIWGVKKSTIHHVEVRRNSKGEIVGIHVINSYKYTPSPKKQKHLETEGILRELKKIVPVGRGEKNRLIEIPLKNYAVFYENDGVVEYSIARSIRNILENELCTNFNRITDIELKWDRGDLIAKIWLP